MPSVVHDQTAVASLESDRARARICEDAAARCSRSSASRASSRSPESCVAQRPTASATTAATAAAAARTGAERRRRRDSIGTTTCRSSRADARIRSRSSGLGAGPDAATASASAVSQNEVSSCGSARSSRVRLVGPALVGVEDVERVAGGQLVNSVFHDLSCDDSSRSSRSLASPENILLLIVPSGTPSLCASSDCEKPP